MKNVDLFRKILTRTFYKTVNPIRKLYWFIFRPNTRGVKCIIAHEDKILFVRLSYGHKHWTLPGGGVNKGESFEDAAIREAKEEVGIPISHMEKIYEYHNNKEYKNDHCLCYFSKVSSPKFNIDNLEISETKWATLANVPEPHVPRVKEILKHVNIYEKN